MSINMTTIATTDRIFYRVKDVVALTGISKAKVFSALKTGQLRALKLDGLLLIPVESFREWISQATPYEPKGDGGTSP